MKFAQYQKVRDSVLAHAAELQAPRDPKLVQPVELAYIGDAVFSLYVRLRILSGSSHVQVLHDLASRMVSAVMQAKAMEGLEKDLTEEETAIVRRGRNTKSMVPKSASVYEYRMGTAFEALLGYLYLEKQEERLRELMDRSFLIIQAAMLAERRGKK